MIYFIYFYYLNCNIAANYLRFVGCLVHLVNLKDGTQVCPLDNIVIGFKRFISVYMRLSNMQFQREELWIINPHMH